jgi:hypothetical protein
VINKAAPPSEAEQRRAGGPPAITTIRGLVRALKIYQHRATGELLLLVDTELRDAPQLVPKPSEWQRMSVGHAQSMHLNELDNVLPLTVENVSGRSTPRLLPPLARSPSSAATTAAAAITAFGASSPSASPRALLKAGKSGSGSGRGLGTQTVAQVVRGMKCYQHQSTAEILLLVDADIKDVGAAVVATQADWKRVHVATQPQQAHLSTLDGASSGSAAAAAAAAAAVPPAVVSPTSAPTLALASPTSPTPTSAKAPSPSTASQGAPPSGGVRRPLAVSPVSGAAQQEVLPALKSPRALPPIASNTAATAAAMAAAATAAAAPGTPSPLRRPVLQLQKPDSDSPPASDSTGAFALSASVTRLRAAARAAPTIGQQSERDRAYRRGSGGGSKRGSASSSSLGSKRGSGGSRSVSLSFSSVTTPPSGAAGAGTDAYPSAATSAKSVDDAIRAALAAGTACGTFTCTCGCPVDATDEAAREAFEDHMRQCVEYRLLSEQFAAVNRALIDAAVVITQMIKREKAHAKADASTARERRGQRCKLAADLLRQAEAFGPDGLDGGTLMCLEDALTDFHARVVEAATRREHALTLAYNASSPRATAAATAAGGEGSAAGGAGDRGSPGAGAGAVAATLLEEDRLLAATMAGALAQLRVKRRALQEHRRHALGPRDFELVSLLSAGGFGHVFLARRRDTGRQVALKVLDKGKARLEYRNEVSRLRRGHSCPACGRPRSAGAGSRATGSRPVPISHNPRRCRRAGPAVQSLRHRPGSS